MTSRCTAAGPCDFHRDGGPADKPCPWFCDRAGCRRKAVIECGRAGRSYCREHASLPGRPVTTGSGSTPKVFFRVSAAERERGEVVAAGRGQSIGELAKLAFLGELERG
jgi:hypothetical protein